MAEPVAGRDSTSLSGRLRGAANILVLEPSFGESGNSVCTELLAGDEPAHTAVMGVTYRESPAEWIDAWERQAGTPGQGLVVSMGDWTETTFPSGVSPEATRHWTVEGIESASDLTQLGIELTEYLAMERESSTTKPRLCFDSVTMLLQYADLKRAFRFLHIVTRRVKAASGVGHYHLDPEAHDQQTMATIKTLFDAVVEVGDSGEWTVETR